MDNTKYRVFTVARSFAYNVYYTPPTVEGKPTLLFLHGFPSTSYDWRKQVRHFETRGFGLLVPDLLGAGATSKPTDSKAFRLGAVAQDIVDILDALCLLKVVGIATDWGSIFLSRLSMLHQDRFYGLAWLGLGFRPANLRPLDLVPDSEIYAYWEFLTRPDAAELIHKHIDSFIQLVYPRDAESWLTWLEQRGKTAECIENNILLGRPDWLSSGEYDKLKQDLLTHGVASSLLWYVNEVEGNDHEENTRIPEDAHKIKVPSLFVGASKDYLCRESAGVAQMQKYASALRTASVPAGHYLHLERADEVNVILEEWLVTVPL
ncbi:uncharacterized protein PHACADRAFT_198096 [Phanerochaete carnosa HHB-10118-sp]|uniref:AB hydrolase-1 domain-containing protein n=1 Tax=Phanerochaete carnosa (strain HHB-10118-sp) TaxID=650164 RepID=K5W403_PHACS|nr:uncharacterized protein PHACADRAFT_198096 [Phanerochaete carnosa HHB-10118-sp]EKM53674.1 hypothetical protein PHACADRAFT_198096 [Phanerochaete carnosa HHB-10118-sp]